jgi:hypothetical protein
VALTRNCQGRPADARRAYDAAVAMMQGRRTDDWVPRLQLELLRAEAAKLLGVE